jgi:surfeit locus 1 family protein
MHPVVSDSIAFPMPLPVPRIAFRPAFWPSLAALIAIVLTGYLGTWQKGRAEEKNALQAEYDARIRQPVITLTAAHRAAELNYRIARADGQWRPSEAIFVDNRQHASRAGFHVIVPLELHSGTRVLVNLGWVARDGEYPRAPRIGLPGGAARIEGMLSVPGTRYIELKGGDEAGADARVWQNFSLERYRARSGRDALPGFQVVAERPDARVEKHLEYMWTWYSLAATVLVLWIALNLSVGESANLKGGDA